MPKRTDKQLRADPKLIADYGHLFNESSHPVYIDKHRVLRWKPNQLVRWFSYQYHPENKLALAYDMKIFTLQEYKEYYRNIGYSLSGFEEVFGETAKRLKPCYTPDGKRR